MEQLCDPVAPRSLRPHLIRSAIFLLVFGAFFVAWAVGFALTALSATLLFNVEAIGLGPRGGSVLSLVGLAGMIGTGAAWIFALCLPVREYVTESDVLLDGRASARAPAHESVRAALAGHEPWLSVQAADTREGLTVSLSGEAQRALVLVRAIGPDLFVGWVIWRNRSTFRLLAQVFADMLDSSGDGDPRLARASATMALRQLLTGATREAVRVAERGVTT